MVSVKTNSDSGYKQFTLDLVKKLEKYNVGVRVDVKHVLKFTFVSEFKHLRFHGNIMISRASLSNRILRCFSSLESFIFCEIRDPLICRYTSDAWKMQICAAIR